MQSQKYWTVLDHIAPTIRACVIKIKYGSATESDLVALLRKEADKLEARQRHEQQIKDQIGLFDDSPPHHPI